MAEPALKRGDIAVSRSDDGALVVRLRGAWTLATGIPPLADVEKALLAAPKPVRIAFDLRELGAWDSGLMSFVTRVGELARERKIPIDEATLPDGLRRLLVLATRVPGQDARHAEPPASRLARIGLFAIAAWHEARAMVAFVGEITLACGRLVRGKARFRARDFWLLVQQTA
jgi:phospholipid/cholesterol/gamma-HCH transport system permease protein